jgi:glycosyltransferase involved in cell wall biosynthesis
VCRAVNSALAQTYKEIEIIVVIDGPDEDTVSALERLNDSRVRILALPENVGAWEARNAGVREAKGAWIAFLDDDDEWLPFKLEKQIQAASRLLAPFPIIASYVIVRTPSGDVVQPTRVPEPDEPICDYLFSRTSFFQKEGLLQTSTFVMKKALLEKVPFRNVTPQEDPDLLLRAARLNGVCFEVVPEPLTVWYTGEQRKSLSSVYNYKSSLKWLRESRDLVTPRAYAGFVATTVADQASRQREWKAFIPLLREMYRFGARRISVYLLYLVIWFIPQDIRRKVRAYSGFMLTKLAGPRIR